MFAMAKSVLGGIPLVHKVMAGFIIALWLAYWFTSKNLEISELQRVELAKDLKEAQEQIRITALQAEKMAKLNLDLANESDKNKKQFSELTQRTNTEFANLATGVDPAAIPPELSGKIASISKQIEDGTSAPDVDVVPVPVVKKEVLDRAFKISIDAMYESYCLASKTCKE